MLKKILAKFIYFVIVKYPHKTQNFYYYLIKNHKELILKVFEIGTNQHSGFRRELTEIISNPKNPWQINETTMHYGILPQQTLSPWLLDKEFMRTYAQVRESTCIDRYRCYELWALAKQINGIEGDILEVGVWKGGSGSIIAKAQPNKKIFLADTFAGVVKAGPNDPCYKNNEHADTTESEVISLMKQLDIENYEILSGIYPDETGRNGPKKISLLHCDVDVYESSKDIIDYCLPMLSLGSIIVFDDYGFFGCEGVTKYCDELRSNKSFHFIHNLNGHAIFIKIQDSKS